jgi:hypothetical protein
MTLAVATEATCNTCRKPILNRRSSLQTKCAPCVYKAANARDKELRKAQRQAVTAARVAHAEDRRTTRAKLEAMKSLGTLRKEAQDAFNLFIKLRDRLAGYGCICCGAPLAWDSGIPGGSVDAGHFVSRGSAIELAFDERNTNAQRKGCNRPGGTTRDKFRAGMTERYGAAVVAELEGPHDLPHLKHDDLRRIRAIYRAKARELQKETA